LDKDPSQTGVGAIVRKGRNSVLAAAFAGLGVAGAVALVLPKSWESDATVEISSSHPLDAADYASQVDTAAAQMRSSSAMLRVVEELKLDEGPGAPAPTDLESVMLRRTQLSEELASSVAVRVEPTGENSSRMRIALRTADPQVSHRGLGALLAVYRTELYGKPRLLQQRLTAGAKAKADETKARADEAEKAVTAYEQANPEFLGDVQKQLAEVQHSIQKIESEDLQEAKKAQAAAEEVLKNEEPTRKSVVRTPDPARAAVLDSQIRETEAKLKELKEEQKRPEDDADVQGARAALAGLALQKAELERTAPETTETVENPIYVENAKRRDEAQAQVFVAEQQLAGCRKNERVLQDKLRKVPEVAAARDKLVAARDAARHEAEAKTAEAAAAEKRLAELEGERRLEFRVTVAPEPAQSPAGTHPALLALCGLAFGGAAGVGVAFSLDSRDRSFRDADAVAALLEIPALGGVPEIATEEEKAVVRGKAARKLAAVAAIGCAAFGVVAWAVVAHARPPQASAPEGGVR
jgi:uncharacterized protein involved in exopolysaccharide biosynthesis